MRLDEDHRLLGIEPSGQPVESNFEGILLYVRRVGVVGSKRVPVCNAKEAFIFVLHSDPILQCAHIIAEMELAGRAHATEHSFAGLRGRSHLSMRAGMRPK